MSQRQWSEVDRYFADLLLAPDAALDAAIEASRAAGLPEIAVAPNQGKLLCLMARASGARRILEIGTLGGYSAIWLARALPDGGKLTTLEFDPKHAEVARTNLARGRSGGPRGGHHRARAGQPAQALGPVRFHLHRRRQAVLPRLFPLGGEVLAQGHRDRRR